MPRHLIPIALAAAVLAAVGWMVLGGSEAPSVPPEGVGPARTPPKREHGKAEEPRPPLVEVTIPVNPPPEVPPEDPPLPPELWPADVPDWWASQDRKLREKAVSFEEDIRSVREICGLLEKESGVPIRFHATLGEWPDEARLSLPLKDVSVREVLETLAARMNVEAVLEPDGFRFYPRGKAPGGALATVSRNRWYLEEATERRAGRRPEDPTGAALLQRKVSLRLDRMPLRDASRALGEAVGVPVLPDRTLWDENPPVSLEEGERPLSEALERIGKDAGCVADVTGRRIVLLKK